MAVKVGAHVVVHAGEPTSQPPVNDRVHASPTVHDSGRVKRWARVQCASTALVALVALGAAFAIIAALNSSNTAAAERRVLQGAESAGAVVLRALLLPTLMLMQTAMSFESSGNASINAFRQGASGTLRAMQVGG